jgi:quercetin dioxygenase-like cupin family protein
MAEMIVRGHGEGERRWFAGGGLHVWKLTAEETGGDFFLFEDHLVKGKTTPLHRHPGIAEAIYLLEGTMRVHVDGAEREIGPGDIVLFPPGDAHALLVTSDTARILCFQSPGAGEAFYRAASDPSTGDAGPVDFGRLRQVADADPSIDILGPPPFRR